MRLLRALGLFLLCLAGGAGLTARAWHLLRPLYGG